MVSLEIIMDINFSDKKLNHHLLQFEIQTAMLYMCSKVIREVNNTNILSNIMAIKFSPNDGVFKHSL